MNTPAVAAIALACIALGFAGGRFSRGSEAEAGETPHQKSPPATLPGTGESSSNSKPDAARTPTATRNGARLAASLREMVATWNNPEITLPNGDKREVMVADLCKLGQVLADLGRTAEGDLAEVREALQSDGSASNSQVMNMLVMMPLIGRDIELRGSVAIDEQIARTKDSEVFSARETVPTMLYSLARRSPEEAAAWLSSFGSRPEFATMGFDMEELKAVIERSRQDP